MLCSTQESIRKYGDKWFTEYWGRKFGPSSSTDLADITWYRALSKINVAATFPKQPADTSSSNNTNFLSSVNVLHGTTLMVAVGEADGEIGSSSAFYFSYRSLGIWSRSASSLHMELNSCLVNEDQFFQWKDMRHIRVSPVLSIPNFSLLNLILDSQWISGKLPGDRPMFTGWYETSLVVFVAATS